MQILGIRWFTNGEGSVGIARVQTKYEGIRYFISAVPGLDETADAQFVADWGSTFPDHAGDALFGIQTTKETT